MVKFKKRWTSGSFGMGAGVFEEIFAPTRHEAAQYLETKKLLPLERFNDDSDNKSDSIFQGKVTINIPSN